MKLLFIKKMNLKPNDLINVHRHDDDQAKTEKEKKFKAFFLSVKYFRYFIMFANMTGNVATRE